MVFRSSTSLYAHTLWCVFHFTSGWLVSFHVVICSVSCWYLVCLFRFLIISCRCLVCMFHLLLVPGLYDVLVCIGTRFACFISCQYYRLVCFISHRCLACLFRSLSAPRAPSPLASRSLSLSLTAPSPPSPPCLVSCVAVGDPDEGVPQPRWRREGGVREPRVGQGRRGDVRERHRGRRLPGQRAAARLEEEVQEDQVGYMKHTPTPTRCPLASHEAASGGPSRGRSTRRSGTTHEVQEGRRKEVQEDQVRVVRHSRTLRSRRCSLASHRAREVDLLLDYTNLVTNLCTTEIRQFYFIFGTNIVSGGCNHQVVLALFI